MPERRRLSVAILVDGLGLSGGGERFARELVRRLDRERFERIYCVSRWSERTAATPGGSAALTELREADVEVLGLSRKSALSIRSWQPMIELLRSRRIDILHAHKFGSNVWAAVLGRRVGTPVVIAHEHSWSYQGRPMRRFLDRELIARCASAFVCVSSEDRRRMIEVERIDPAKIVLLRTGIPRPPPPTDRDVRGELGIESDDPVIGTVSVLRPEKAVDVLLRAAAVLVRQSPRLRIVIVGDGPERPALEALAGSLGLGAAVRFVGHRSDVPDLLTTFDLAISSSDREGVPLAVMEYMAAGLPIVATRVGGVPELIVDGVHGRLVPPRDPERLAAAAAELLGDPGAAAGLARRAQEHQREEFDIGVAVRRVEALYERLHAASERANLGHMRR